VGIGTVSPTQLLNVVNDTTGTWTAKFTNNTNNVYLSVNDANNYGIYVSGESKNYFSGNVGIGTTTPTSKLHLRDPGSNSDVGIKIGNDSRDWNLKVMGSVSDSLQFFTHDNSNVMTILPSGNVGIGTSTPEEKLVVIGDIGFGAGGYNGGVYANNNSSATGVDSNWGLEVQRTSNVDDYNTRLKYYPTNGSTRRAGIWNSRDDYFTIYSDDDHVPNVIIPSGELGIGTPSPAAKLHIKDSQDSSLYSGLKVERSANTTAAYLNAVGGALNLNTDSSMPLKFRIQNTSMQTISPDGGRAYAANASGLNMKEYGYNFTAANGVTVDLFENTSAHSDVTMVQISITAYHSSRSFFAGMGTFGGYGFHLTGAGNGLGNGGLTSTSTGTGTRKLQWSNTSGYNAVVRLYIQIRSEAGINVLNGTLSSL
jgi:hypothetical protein